MTESNDELDRQVDQVLRAVGARFLKARTDREVGPTTLSERARISRNTLRLIERGENIELRTLIRAALALGVAPATLFDDEVSAARETIADFTTAFARLLTALPPEVRREAEQIAEQLGDAPAEHS